MSAPNQPAAAPGAGVALLTLFDHDGTLLIDQTAEHAQRLVDHGCASVLVAATSGEFWALQDDERVRLVAAVADRLDAAVPVIAHVGGVPADRAATLAGQMTDVGATALLALPLGVPTAQLPAYYVAITTAAKIPVLAYHLPQAQAEVPSDVLLSLGVAGIKDSSGDGERLASEVLELGLETYIGAPTLLGLAHDIGAAGALLGLTNAWPELVRDAFAGDRAASRSLATRAPASARDFPSALKAMTAERWATPIWTR